MSKRFTSHNGHDNGERGFTLVEILTAMVILLIIVTACFPLFTLATKITHDNKARMTANELAKRELEWTMAQVTSGNYLNEGTDPKTAPLAIGVSETYYFDDNGNRVSERDRDSQLAKFEARKIVEWIDDPADGEYPSDMIPFDYKALIIEVSCPSLFTGNVTKKADFKTFVSREGTSSPITGVIVEVVRGWTGETGARIPLEGATVSLDGTGPSYTVMTNASGQALIPMTFPNDNTVYSYQVVTEYSGMIPRPDQPAVAVEARPYTTNYVQVEMEEPAALTLLFTPCENDVTFTLDGGPAMGIKNQTVTAGQSSVTFTDLWPAGIDPDNAGKVCSGGTYSLSVSSLLSYDYLPDTSLKYPEDNRMNEDETDILNLWGYISDYNGKPAWVACDDYLQVDETINDAEIHSITFTDAIDLTSFKPVLSGVTSAINLSFDNFSLSGYEGINDDFTLVYLGEAEASLSNNDNWTAMIRFGTEAGKKVLFDTNNTLLSTDGEPGYLIIPMDASITLASEYLDHPFRMRFDSHNPDIKKFSFSGIKIRCSYDNFGSIQFTGPGDNFSLRISGQ